MTPEAAMTVPRYSLHSVRGRFRNSVSGGSLAGSPPKRSTCDQSKRGRGRSTASLVPSPARRTPLRSSKPISPARSPAATDVTTAPPPPEEPLPDVGIVKRQHRHIGRHQKPLPAERVTPTPDCMQKTPSRSRPAPRSTPAWTTAARKTRPSRPDRHDAGRQGLIAGGDPVPSGFDPCIEDPAALPGNQWTRPGYRSSMT